MPRFECDLATRNTLRKGGFCDPHCSEDILVADSLGAARPIPVLVAQVGEGVIIQQFAD